jgi:hypothetical protein
MWDEAAEMKNIISVLALCVVLVGCAPIGQLYTPSMIQPPKSGAQLVVYYPNSINGIRGMSLFVNDKECSLLANGFMVANVHPGNIIVKMGDDSTTVSIKSRTTKFIKISMNTGKQHAQAAAGLVGLFVYNAATHGTKNEADYFFESIDSDTAKKELDGMQQSVGCP